MPSGPLPLSYASQCQDMDVGMDVLFSEWLIDTNRRDSTAGLHDTISKRIELEHQNFAIQGHQRTRLAGIDASLNCLRAMHETYVGNMSHLQAKVDRIPQMSTQQSDQICSLLRSLQDQIRGVASATISPENESPLQRTKSEGMRDSSIDNGSTKETKMTDSISRLCVLAREKGCTKSSEEAEDVIDDLCRLLKYVSTQLAQEASVDYAFKKNVAWRRTAWRNRSKPGR